MHKSMVMLIQVILDVWFIHQNLLFSPSSNCLLIKISFELYEKIGPRVSFLSQHYQMLSKQESYTIINNNQLIHFIQQFSSRIEINFN